MAIQQEFRKTTKSVTSNSPKTLCTIVLSSQADNSFTSENLDNTIKLQLVLWLVDLSEIFKISIHLGFRFGHRLETSGSL